MSPAPAAAPPASFARNVRAMLLGHGGRAALQGVYFLLLARALQADGYGAFSAVLAVVALAMPFASLGAVHLMIRAVSRDRSRAPEEFASAVGITLLGGSVATAVVTVAGAWVLGADVPWWVVAAIAAADLVGNLLAEVAAGVFTATERMSRTAAVQLGFHGLRLLAALVLLVAPWGFTLTTWAWAYALSSLVGAGAAVLLVHRHLAAEARRAAPGPRGAAHPLAYLRQWRDGSLFAVGLASQAAYNDIDKTMLPRMAGLEAAGVYSAAYRVVDMAFTPLRAVLAAAYPRFFREGASGLAAAVAVSRRLVVPGVGYAVLAGIALFLAAPLLPALLGASYAGSVAVLRGLAVLPVLKVVHYLAADALTGAGHQGARSAWQVAVAVLNVGLNLWLIPAHGVAGAVVSSLVCDGLLGLALWCLVLRRLRAARRVAGEG